MDRRLVGMVVALIFFLGLFSFYSWAIGQDVFAKAPLLKHKDPEVRIAASRVLGEQGDPAAILLLLQALEEEDDPGVRAAIAKSLRSLTGEDFGGDADRWRDWWKEEGIDAFVGSTVSNEGNQAMMQSFSLLFLGVVACTVLLILFMIVFTGMASSKIKEMKGLLTRVEGSIVEEEKLRERSDHLREDIEQEGRKIHQALRDVVDENRSEIERNVDFLQSNAQHNLREAVMKLRDNAEKELGQTVKNLVADVERGARQQVAEAKEKLSRTLREQEQAYFQEVDFQTSFLEASFLFLQGKHEDSLKIYRRLLLLKPDHYVAWNNQGTVLREIGRLDEAIESYERAIELSADADDALYNKAATLALLKRRDAMMETLRLAIQKDQEYGDDALNDDAFREYWKDADFKALAEG